MSITVNNPDENIFERCERVMRTGVSSDPLLDSRVREIREHWEKYEQIYEVLCGIKATNPEYRETLDTILGGDISAVTSHVFSEHFSAEHALGYRAGISVFCQPEIHLKQVREEKKRELEILGEYDNGTE